MLTNGRVRTAAQNCFAAMLFSASRAGVKSLYLPSIARAFESKCRAPHL